MTSGVTAVWPLFMVADLAASLRFYRDVLGFVVVGTAEDDSGVYWCRLEHGGACVMLERSPGPDPIRTGPDAHYLVCDDVERIREDLAARGLEPEPIRHAPYGMRQLAVQDPDGRSLVFETPTADWRG